MRIELSRHPNPEARELLERALEDRWLRVVPLAGAVPADLVSVLDVGEAEALALALEIKAEKDLLMSPPRGSKPATRVLPILVFSVRCGNAAR